MIKLGETRINPGNIVQYYAGTDNYIHFELITGKIEKISFEHKEQRDSMLQSLDEFLVAFDNGTINLPKFINMAGMMNTPESQDGPGGMSLQ